jgi:WD40 repeat protein
MKATKVLSVGEVKGYSDTIVTSPTHDDVWIMANDTTSRLFSLMQEVAKLPGLSEPISFAHSDVVVGLGSVCTFSEGSAEVSKKAEVNRDEYSSGWFEVEGSAMSDDGELLVVGSRWRPGRSSKSKDRPEHDELLKVYNARNNTKLQTLRHKSCYSACFSPDNKYLVAGTCQLNVWARLPSDSPHIFSDEPIASISWQSFKINTVTFSRDGQYLFAGAGTLSTRFYFFLTCSFGDLPFSER